MRIYKITNPMRLKPIGKMHTTLAAAKRAALRASKRYGHAKIEHWRDGVVEIVFPEVK